MKKRNNRKLTQKVGLPPGSLIYSGDRSKLTTGFRFFQYDANEFKDWNVTDEKDLNVVEESSKIDLFEISGFTNSEVIEKVGQKFNIHLLLLEDIVNSDHHPKFEEDENNALLILKLYVPNPETKKVEGLHIGLILGRSYVVIFQENDHNVFDQKIERIKQGKGKARTKKADYLFYVLTDAIVDNYYMILEEYRERLSNLEDRIFEETSENLIGSIYEVKRELGEFRRILFPLKEAISDLIESESELIDEETLIYFRDVHDHTKHLLDIYNSFAETIASLVELNNSNISNNMNSVMKMLTLIATIFIPLTFIAGVYGMNFKNMPELDWNWGYPITLALMFIVGVSMFVYMKWKKWL